MKKLLLGEWYKISKNWLILGILLFLTAFCAFISGQTAVSTGFDPSFDLDYLNSMFQQDMASVEELAAWIEKYEVRSFYFQMLVPLWSSVILVVLFLGQDFDNRAISIPILLGHQRRTVFLEKLIWYYGTGLLLSQFSLYLAMTGFRPDWMRALPARELVRNGMLRIVADLATLSIPFCIAFLCRDLLKTIGCSAAYVMILTYLQMQSPENPNVITEIFSYHPVLYLRNMLQHMDPVPREIHTLLLISLGMVLICVVIGYLVFRRSAIK